MDQTSKFTCVIKHLPNMSGRTVPRNVTLTAVTNGDEAIAASRAWYAEHRDVCSGLPHHLQQYLMQERLLGRAGDVK